jgi:CHASE3 domain sensor protein
MRNRGYYAEFGGAFVPEILAATIDAETGQRGYLLTGEARYLGPFERAQPRLRSDIGELRRLLATDPEQLAAVNELAAVIDAVLAAGQKFERTAA